MVCNMKHETKASNECKREEDEHKLTSWPNTNIRLLTAMILT